MGFLSWIILGLIAGALAILMPGNDGGGWIATMVLGIVGAFVGGFLGSFVGLGGADGVNIGSIVTATLGAFVILFVYNRFLKVEHFTSSHNKQTFHIERLVCVRLWAIWVIQNVVFQSTTSISYTTCFVHFPLCVHGNLEAVINGCHSGSGWFSANKRYAQVCGNHVKSSISSR